MSEYRFLRQTSPTVWWRILLVVVIVIGVPIAINMSVPEMSLKHERPLELSDSSSSWSVPVHRDNGEPWLCTRQSSLTMGYDWDCGSARISTRLVLGIEDMEVALLRELRSSRFDLNVSEDYFWVPERSTGDAILVDHPTGDAVIAAHCGNQDCEDEYIMAYVPGDSDVLLLRDAWRELTNKDLPTQVELSLTLFSDRNTTQVDKESLVARV